MNVVCWLVRGCPRYEATCFGPARRFSDRVIQAARSLAQALS